MFFLIKKTGSYLTFLLECVGLSPVQIPARLHCGNSLTLIEKPSLGKTKYSDFVGYVHHCKRPQTVTQLKCRENQPVKIGQSLEYCMAAL